ncbi:MAG TPA: Ig-like domain-containing protein [Gemmatimonadaceae bacterium]|nr:Ig-like domain-containing protein [Gemmatimonadaceae bacterium]
MAPTDATLGTGASLPLHATVTDAAGNVLPDRKVFWNTSDESIVTVDGNGIVTARAPGSAQVAASADGRSAFAAITVLPTAVATVVVVPSQANVTVGGSVQLRAQTLDGGGANLPGRPVLWASSDEAVATVDEAGLVTARFPGSATITATSEGKTGQATVTVNLVPVASVTIAPDPTKLVPGQTAQLAATVRDAGGNVLTGRTISWATGDHAVATVTTSGVVTAVGVGSTTVSAATGGITGTAAVVVAAPAPSSVNLNPSALSLTVGQSAPVAATVRDASGNVLPNAPVAWATDNAAVATVSSSGTVTATGAGTATITASSGGATAALPVTVSLIPVASVALVPSSASVHVGRTVQLAAVTKDANGNVLTGRQIVWSSTNTAIATVSQSGLVTAVSKGSVTITAISEGQVGTASVTATVGSPGGSPGSIIIIGGNGQSGSRDTPLPAPLVVQVNDQVGTALPGIPVSWNVKKGKGAANPTSAVTDAAGRAQTTWTLGKSNGRQELEATVPGLPPALFSADAH